MLEGRVHLVGGGGVAKESSLDFGISGYENSNQVLSGIKEASCFESQNRIRTGGILDL